MEDQKKLEGNKEDKASSPLHDIKKEHDIETNTSDSSCEAKTSFFKKSIPKRYVLLFMTWLGFINIYAMRVDLNVAIVGMVNNQEITRNGVLFTKVMI